MTELSVISTDQAPKAVGPYSQAIRAGSLLFCSGQIPLHPETQQLVVADIAQQTEQVCQNLGAVLKAAGLNFTRVLKTKCYLKDMNDFSYFNEVYGRYFGKFKPARATVEVSRLPKDVKIEIEAIASF